MSASFPAIRFSGQLRPSQEEVVDIARDQLRAGERQLHIVAPPGSGKTVLGLYLWAEMIKQPCLVLSPNSAIQSQWAARTDLFEFETSRSQLVSTAPESPSALTSLTYQSVTMPSRKNHSVDTQAVELWCDRLIEEQQALNVDEAKVWIRDLKNHNPDYFQQRFSSYKKQVRDEIARDGDSLTTLHPSSIATLERIAAQRIGVLILDECHHLLGHWGRVLSDALTLLNHPVVIGLTATPPDRSGKDQRDVDRYDQFFGGIDYEIPIPAVVKDGFLAPYQDLAYFVRPTAEELKFVASADERLEQLIVRLCSKEATISNDPLETDENGETEPELETGADPTRSRFDWNEEPDEFALSGDPAHQPSLDAETDISDSPSNAAGGMNLIEWVEQSLLHRVLPTGKVKTWRQFAKRDPGFSLAARQFLQSRDREMPGETPPLGPLESHDQIAPMEFLVPVLDRYVRHYLRRSRESADHQTAREVTSSLRLLGVQITETGSQACASPVSRILAYSNSKAAALSKILSAEMDHLGETTRAVVIADFEKSSAVRSEIRHLMDQETGGAIAAFKAILADEKTDRLDPILVTGSTILIDDEIESRFLEQSRKWLAARSLSVGLESRQISSFYEITGSGADWSPRVYVELITELFQQGLTRCLVGTRGLLGEGWDANKINVLVDLTTVTTSMSINQLRGRSIRLDPDVENKLANNWDVICLAPEFTKGFDDYRRFIEKHKNLYGVADDGTIEKGVGHVHPAFTEIKPEGLESSTTVFNAEMLERAGRRDRVRESWKIGQPFESKPIRAIEAKLEGIPGSFPAFGKASNPWTDESLTQAIANAVLDSLMELGKIQGRKKAAAHQIAGGYIRMFLEEASDEEGELFSRSMKEILGPLDRPRYVIERIVEIRKATLLSKWLPQFIGRYFEKRKNLLAMLHAVPTELARNKKSVEIFQRHWNRWVSPGEAHFAHRGQGEAMLQQAKQSGTESAAHLHEKEVFV